MQKIMTLSNIGNGLADELFAAELEKVLNNIADKRTSSTSTREIVVTVFIKPDEMREAGNVDIKTKAKLAPIAGKKAMVYFSRDEEGEVRATTADPKQCELGLDFVKKQSELGGR